MKRGKENYARHPQHLPRRMQAGRRLESGFGGIRSPLILFIIFSLPLLMIMLFNRLIFLFEIDSHYYESGHYVP
jgi:hypothetical protein